MSIRFNDEQNGEDLVALIERTVKAHAPDAQVIARISGEAFLTQPGELSALVTRAIEKVAGVVPALSTTGGTSDARFLSQLCPTVEFGLVNATMHKTDEAVALADLADLVDIYAEIIAAIR
jgi:succinyl-diaminopimelate desuccinylase